MEGKRERLTVADICAAVGQGGSVTRRDLSDWYPQHSTSHINHLVELAVAGGYLQKWVDVSENGQPAYYYAVKTERAYN